ncbi:ABC transporter permease subunit [Apilactobacillus kunkeei]|nr:ABC transporter permease subunit [Apilactobacillus kunkeei]
MLTLIRQELYKQLHGKFYIGWGIVILAITLFSGYSYQKINIGINPVSRIFSNGNSMSMIAMIIFASSILTVDFSQNTVKYLFARQFSRGQILISKLVTIVLMYVYLTIINFVTTEISNLIFNKNGAWNFADVFTNVKATSFYLFLLLSMVLLISNIFKSNAIAIAIGIVFVYVSQTINSIISLFTENHSWVKFNPLNFLNVNSEVMYGESMFKQVTKLSLIQIEIGAIIWGIIFLFITYVVYNRRNV